MNFFQNKNIIITGAGSGIGRQCAIDLDNVGANLLLIDIDKDGLFKTNSLLKKTHEVFITDLSKFQCKEGIIDFVSKNGKVSGFLHSAGISSTMPLKAMKADDYIRMYSINTVSAFEIIKIINSKKISNFEDLSIVLIASINGVFGQPGKSCYSASKGAIIAAVKSIAIELAPKGIRVNSIAPGVVRTEMFERAEYSKSQEAMDNMLALHPLGFGSPEDVSNAVQFLLSDKSKWITGVNLMVDGGYSAL